MTLPVPTNTNNSNNAYVQFSRFKKHSNTCINVLTERSHKEKIERLSKHSYSDDKTPTKQTNNKSDI